MAVYDWLDRLGAGFPLVALIWSWILGNSMHLVYLPWAPYAMLALTVWIMVLLTRMCSRGQTTRVFPGGWWVAGLVILASLGAILWMALFVVGFGISEFSLFPAVLLVIYTFNQILSRFSRKLPIFTFFLGGMAFAYGCAVPVWYSAAIYSVPGFIVDQRTLYLGLMMFLFLMANELWKRERAEYELGSEMDWEEEEARLMVWVSLPLLILAGFCLYLAYVWGNSGAWYFYSLAISSGLMHVLNRSRFRLTMSQLRLLLFVCLIVPGVVQLFRNAL